MQRRLRELGARYDLGEVEVDRLARLLEHLAADEHAPTPIREPARAVDAHVADSLVALTLAEVREARVIADLGAGAGYPGLALAVALPRAHVHAVETVARKAVGIADAAEAAGIANLSVHAARAEAWAEGMGRCDLVVARALAALPVLVEYAAPLLTVGGHLVAWKGAPAGDEEQAGSSAADQVGMAALGHVAVTPFPGTVDRRLYRYVKRAPTPDRYPRRPGMATKRPLG